VYLLYESFFTELISALEAISSASNGLAVVSFARVKISSFPVSKLWWLIDVVASSVLLREAALRLSRTFILSDSFANFWLSAYEARRHEESQRTQ
jgi:hypothetical protein